MHGPALVSWLLAALTAAAGTYCLSRLRDPSCEQPGAADRPGLFGHESNAAEALMGLGMAAMAVTGGLVPPALWAWLFGLPAAGFLVAALAPGPPARRAHRLHHAIGALAMTYMALAMAGAAGAHAHHAAGGAGLPPLTGGLLLYFGAYTLWAGSRLLATPSGVLRSGTAGLPQACRLTMGIGMFAMLLTL
ncbi:DUF5134 domain-containing protein [Kitasatospora sp. NPDC057015]|uniref:DUF5134 domain-containing protein n=1 Tax=Kitasatospora sp. NPDC057015 TaxID=3346001 RepID=UPI00364450DC